MDDQPAVMLEYETKTRMLEMASQGECKDAHVGTVHAL